MLRAIDVARPPNSSDGPGRMLLFWSGNSVGALAVEARSLENMERLGSWALPDSFHRGLWGGCALGVGFSALALPNVGTSPDGPSPSLLHLKFA